MTATETDIDTICQVLDKLTLDALLLIEDEIQAKLNIENAMSSGESHLAKSRYIMGQNKVCSIQLPTEKSSEFTAGVKVHSTNDEKLFNAKSFDLQSTKKNEENSVQDPMKWFGILVPQNLTLAQSMFCQALQWAVKAVNTQTQLTETIEKINELEEIKSNLVENK